jgi:hypothetical protein
MANSSSVGSSPTGGSQLVFALVQSARGDSGFYRTEAFRLFGGVHNNMIYQN